MSLLLFEEVLDEKLGGSILCAGVDTRGGIELYAKMLPEGLLSDGVDSDEAREISSKDGWTDSAGTFAKISQENLGRPQFQQYQGTPDCSRL